MRMSHERKGVCIMLATLAAFAILCSGCSTIDKAREQYDQWRDKPDLPTEGQPGKPIPPGQTGDAIDLSTVVWHGTDTRSWPVTTTLDASISGGTVHLRNEGTRRWTDVGARGSQGQILVGNAWVICMIDGKWQAATWEWMGKNQQSKQAKALAGDHINRAPWPIRWSTWWGPGCGLT